ncbi:hypothetical protein YC2023_026199 [Brassica napus]
MAAQCHKTKPTTKPIQMVNRDKETVAVSATNRIQRCSSKSTERQRLQLHNRYALLTVDGVQRRWGACGLTRESDVFRPNSYRTDQENVRFCTGFIFKE